MTRIRHKRCAGSPAVARYRLRRLGFVTAIAAVGLALQANAASPAPLSYSGRLLGSSGQPLAGSVDILVRFFRAAEGGTALIDPVELPQTLLTDGVFQVEINVDGPDLNAVLGDGSDAIYIEIEAGGKTYPRQRFVAAPLALRVPIDESLAFDSQGRLGIHSVRSDQVLGLSAALGDKADAGHSHNLGGDLSGTVAGATVSKLQGRSISPASPSNQQVLQWDGSAWSPSTLALNAGTVTSVGVSAPLSVSNASSTPSISLPQAGASSSGYLNSSDWAAFNSKQTALGFAPVNKAGDSLSGALHMGTYKIIALGEPTAASDAATKNYVDLSLGGVSFDQSGRANDVVVKWDHSNSKFVLAADQLGSAGGGISNFNGLNTSSQTLAVGSSGTAPAFISTTSTHTLNIPNAQTGSVTAGLISNSEYQAFNNKIGGVAAGTGVNVSTSGTTATVHLANTAVSAGSYTRANITVDAQGRLTAAASGSSINLASEVTGTLPVASGGTGATSVADARSSMGLGTLATLNSVGSAEIANDSIVNADVSSSAAIVTSKLSGPVTAIASHGLGALATLSSIGSTEITNDSITDADISAAAAISSSKISFAADGISGNAIDGGTISNFASTGIDDNASSTTITVTSAGNVGIGTTSPSQQLNITQNALLPAAVSNTNGNLFFGGDTSTGANGMRLFTVSDLGFIDVKVTSLSNGLVFRTDTTDGDTERMRITAGGNVGIGTTAPAFKLDAVGGFFHAGVNSASVPPSDNANGGLVVGWNRSGGDAEVNLYNAFDGSGGSGFQFSGKSGASTYKDYMTITGSGNVGIGTTAPSRNLEVSGDINPGIISMKVTNRNSTDSGSPAEIFFDRSAIAGGTQMAAVGVDSSARDFFIWVNGADRINVTENGNVGIGTSTPTSTLQVNGRVAANGFQNNNSYYIFIGGGTINSYSWGAGYYLPLWSFTNITANNLSSANFSGTTGEFIAPVKGLWSVKCSLVPSGGSGYEFFLAKNATSSPLNVGTQDLLGLLNNISEGTLTSPVLLDVNDKVGCGSYAVSGSITSWTPRTSFSAVLLQLVP